VGAASEAWATDVCINGPGVYSGSYDAAAVRAVIAMHPRCVRVDLRQDVWSSLDDTTAHGRLGTSLWGTYDALVGEYLAAGIEPYVLVSSGVANLPPDAMRSAAGLDTYAHAFVQVVDHLRDRVRTYEVVNEPNNWIRADYPALDAPSFARV